MTPIEEAWAALRTLRETVEIVSPSGVIEPGGPSLPPLIQEVEAIKEGIVSTVTALRTETAAANDEVTELRNVLEKIHKYLSYGPNDQMVYWSVRDMVDRTLHRFDQMPGARADLPELPLPHRLRVMTETNIADADPEIRSAP